MAIKRIPAPEYGDVAVSHATSHQKARAQDAANALVEGFDWTETAEGNEFWDGVYERLIQIAEDGVLK